MSSEISITGSTKNRRFQNSGYGNKQLQYGFSSEMKNFCLAGFGEAMLRLSPVEKKRFIQVLPGQLEATFGGSEANVCASVAILGSSSRYLSALPNNLIARRFTSELSGLGCDTSRICFRDTGRMGIYYVEHGSNMRNSNVVYDREFSTIALSAPSEYDFETMLDGVTHLHLSGITPALSRNAFETTLALAEFAADRSISISVDLNYRKKLWNWEPGVERHELARRCMPALVSLADVIIGNEEDVEDVFSIKAGQTSVEIGKLDIAGYREVAIRLSERFSRAKFVAITLRESISADHNNWGGMLYDRKSGTAHFAPLNDDGNYAPYEILNIVDRFGGGDAFCAGLLFALNRPEFSAPEVAIRFAVAAGALKHTIHGDYNFSSTAEVESLMNGSISGRVHR